MSLNAGSFLICTIHASWSSSLIRFWFQRALWEAEASGGCEKGWGCLHRDALQGRDCQWFSPADMMNRGYCQDLFEHLEELDIDLLRIVVQWWIIYCSCEHSSAACEWNPFHPCLASNKMVRVLCITVFHREIWWKIEKRTSVCWHDFAFSCECVCLILSPLNVLFAYKRNRRCLRNTNLQACGE